MLLTKENNKNISKKISIEDLFNQSLAKFGLNTLTENGQEIVKSDKLVLNWTKDKQLNYCPIKWVMRHKVNKELSSLIAKKTIPTYINQRENITSKLYYPIVLDELGFISRSISRMSNVDTVNFAFVINSQEIAEKEHDKDVFKDILNLQEKGFEFYLQIKRGDFILKNASFEAFDGYLVDASNIYLSSLDSGDKFKDDSIIILDVVPGETYVLELLEYSW